MTWRVQPQSSQSMWLRVGVVAGFVGLGLLVAVIVFLLRRQAPVPALTLTPASGPPGTAITVQGQRWPANAPLTIALTRPGQTIGEEMGATWSTAEGTFSFDMTFPTTGVWTTLSSADVVARSLDGETTARAPFGVMPTPPGGVFVRGSATPGATPTPPPTQVIGTVPVVTLPARTAVAPGGVTGQATATTSAPGGRIRVVGVVQSLALGLDGLVLDPLEGNIRQVLAGGNTVILGQAGQPIALDAIPIGSVVEAEGELDGGRLRAGRIQVRAIPPTPVPPIALPSATPRPADPTATPLVIIVTATPLPASVTPLPTATGLPTLTPTRTATSPVITAWRGEYWANRDQSGDPFFVRNDEEVDFSWSRPPSAPDGRSLPSANWSARWTRRLRFDDGWYTFKARADDGVRVRVDGNLLIDEWHASGGTEVYQRTVRLGAGMHTVQVDYYQANGGASVVVWWEPLGFSGWRSEYWANRDLAGTPDVIRDQDRVYDDWGTTGSPDPLIPPTNFSARYTRRLAFEEGLYRFTVTVDDGARFWIDGWLVIDAWRDQVVTTYQVDRQLGAGDHDLRLEYYNRAGRALIQFGWTRIYPTSTPPPTNTTAPTRTATTVVLPTATRPFTPTVAPTRTPTATPPPPSATATGRPATATATTEAGATATRTATALAPTTTATALPPTVTATAPPPTATRTPTRPAGPTPTATVVRPWQARDFPLAPPGTQLESYVGRIANVVQSNILPRCFTFDLQVSGATVIPVTGHSETVLGAMGLDRDQAQPLSPVCDDLPPERTSVHVWGTRAAPGGPLVALRVELAERGGEPGQDQPPLYQRSFILDAEFNEAASVLVNTPLWVRTTASAAPALVRDREGLGRAFNNRGLVADAPILLRGELPSGEAPTLVEVTAWVFDGTGRYTQVYPAP